MKAVFQGVKKLSVEEAVPAKKEAKPRSTFSFNFQLGGEEGDGGETKKKKRNKKKKKKSSANNATADESGSDEDDEPPKGDASKEEAPKPTPAPVPVTKPTPIPSPAKPSKVVSTPSVSQSTESAASSSKKANNKKKNKAADSEAENNKKESNVNNKKGNSSKTSTNMVTEDDDFLEQAIKANALAIAAAEAEKKQKAKLDALSAPPGLVKKTGPHFISPNDPELDQKTKMFAKFGQGKNLVAIGPKKVKDPAWMREDVAADYENDIASQAAETVLEESNAPTLHQSAFTFSFNGL